MSFQSTVVRAAALLVCTCALLVTRPIAGQVSDEVTSLTLEVLGASCAVNPDLRLRVGNRMVRLDKDEEPDCNMTKSVPVVYTVTDPALLKRIGARDACLGIRLEKFDKNHSLGFARATVSRTQSGDEQLCIADYLNWSPNGGGACEDRSLADGHSNGARIGLINSDDRDDDGDGIRSCVDEDRDGDGVDDELDNCRYAANADQMDSDEDGIGNVCDPTPFPPNDTPVINSTAPATATEDTLYSYDASMTDTDGPGETWSVLGDHTCGGTLNSNDGLFTFTPAGPTPSASCVVALQVCDGGAPNECATQTTTVTITAVNDAPVMSSSAPGVATEDTLYTYNASRTDVDGPGQTWSFLGTHTCGGAIAAASGLVTFTPLGPTPAASCTVAIRVCDGGAPDLCAAQSATVTITAVNDAPVISSSAPGVATEDTLYTYNASRTDVDGPGQNWSLLPSQTCGGSINAASGVFTFTPAGPTPPASCIVAIQVCDGGTPNLCTTQTASVTVTAVNDAPVITTTPPPSATEDALYSYDAAAAPSDGPSETWSFGAGHTCGGSITAGGGAFAFTPIGPVPPASCTVAIQVCDDGTPNLCATQSATVTITAVNDAPVITTTPPLSATEDALYSYDAAAAPSDGPTETWSFGAGHTCGGAINAVSGLFAFTPAGPTPPSTCVVAISVCDGTTPLNQCVTQTANITVTFDNDVPVITTTPPPSATEDALYSYDAAAAPSDGPTETWSFGAGHTCGGAINAVSGLFAFTPAGPTPLSTCVVAISVCDGTTPLNQCVTQTANITVTFDNDVPVITTTPPTVATEDVPYSYDAAAAPSDGPTETWSFGAGHTCGGSINPASGVFTFTPVGPTPHSTCVVAISVCDGTTPLNQCVTQTANITVTFDNDVPVITTTPPTVATEDVLYSYDAAAAPSDGPSELWSIAPAHTCGGSINPVSGVFTFTPVGPTPQSTCIVSIQLCDGTAPVNQCVTQTTEVTITAVNDAPVITTTPPTVATEDVLYSYDAAAAPSDGPSELWSFAPAHTCGGSINPVSGVFTFTPVGPTPQSTCMVSIQLCDGTAPVNQCVTQTTEVTITTVNDAPVISSSVPTPATEDTLYTYIATASDVDGPVQTWTLLGGTHTCGGSIVAGTGVFTFTPFGPIPQATCTVAVRVCDGGTPNQCTNQTATVTITPVNDAPVVDSTPPSPAIEDTLYTYNATRNDPDGPGQIWSITGAHTCGGSITAATGVFTFTPVGPVPQATCVVGVQVCDVATPSLCGTQSTTVSIAAVNDAPVINSTAAPTAIEDAEYTYNATAIDPDGLSKTWSLLPTNTCGGSINASTGAYAFTPAPSPPGSTCTVAIQVCDGGAPVLCTTQSTLISITPGSEALSKPIMLSPPPASRTRSRFQ